VGPGGFAVLHSVEIYVMDADGANQRRITHDQAFAGSPAWSADGTRLAFYTAAMPDVGNITSPRHLRGTGQIATLNLQTNERTTLTSGNGEKWSPRWLSDKRLGYVSGGPEGGLEFTAGSPGARGEFGSPSWSADGKRMIFHRDVESHWPPHRAWHTLDPRFRLTRTGVFPSYSPTGERMIANDQTAGILHNSILIMRADGSQSSVLFGRPDKSALAPTWSHRGDHIAFALGTFFQKIIGTSTADIAVIRDDGSGLRVLTDGKANYGFPSWAGDGMRLVYREASAQKNALHILDTRTNTKRVLVGGPAHYNFPSWSPVADVIAFTSDLEGDYEIYSIHADGTHLKRLTHVPGNDAHCAWSPDGQWLAFASSRGGFKDEAALHPLNPQPYGEIYVMRADGSEARALTDDQFEEATPTWMPLRRSRQGVLAALPPDSSQR
jgi:Tol biopolymer transport system component